MAHDRVTIKQDYSRFETHVSERQTQKGVAREFVERPLRDELIQSAIAVSDIIKLHHQEVYVPTGSFQLMKHLSSVAPSAALLFSDFEYFPKRQEELPPAQKETQELIKNEPAVHATIDGRTKNFRSMLRVPYGADIYFPTDFDALEKVWTHFNPTSRVATLKNSEFFRRYADDITLKACKSLDGYSPLLSDYENTSFFLTLPEVLQQQAVYKKQS